MSLKAVLFMMTLGGLVSVLHAEPIAIPESAKLHSYEASPEVYQLLSENEHFRVILATWAAGQSDKWHSHTNDLTNYTLTECHLRASLPDGRTGELYREINKAGFNTVSTHKITNIGENECRLLIVERKSS